MSKAIVGLLGLWAVAGAWAAAPPVKSNPRVADEAMVGFLRLADAQAAPRLLAEERKFLEIGALRSPDEIVAADVLLNRGLTGVGVQALLQPRELTLVGLEAKIPLASGAKITTVWIGQHSLVVTNAKTLDEKVDVAIGRERHKFMQRARHFDPNVISAEQTMQIEELRENAFSHEFAAYRLQVIGTRAHLFTLLRDNVVRGVFVKRDSDFVDAKLEERRQLERMAARLGPSVRMGRIEVDDPLPRFPAPPPSRRTFTE